MKKIFTLACGLAGTLPTVHSQLISQVYGGGGNSNATYTHDYIELFNPTATAISLAGYSVQYASATSGNWQVTALPDTASIGAYGYYLVREGGTTANALPLPTPDALGSIAMAATAGKVALVSSTTPLGTTAAPATCASSGSHPTLRDLVGYGSTSCYIGTGPAPAPSILNAVFRDPATYQTTNNNAAFTAAAAAPRNSAVILPVKLLSFTVSPVHAHLIFHWQTAAEIHSSHFEIQQSLNGFSFQTFATLPGGGNSNTVRTYTYQGSPAGATCYYRLKMVDQDGQFTTSTIVKVNAVQHELGLGNVYPVPASSLLTVEWNSRMAGPATISLTDLGGRCLQTRSVQAEQGFNRIRIPISSLPAGSYCIRISHAGYQVQTIVTRQ